MKFLRNLLIFVIILILLALINRWYLGGFTTLEAKEQITGPYMVAYMSFTGAYSKVWPTMTKVYDILSGAGVTSATGAGIYYDDPAVVSWADLRSDIGAVIATQDLGKLVGNKNIRITTIPQRTRVVVEFPLKNSLSYMVGPMKAYPAMTAYMKEKWYSHEISMIELYDMMAKKIYYMAVITK